MRTIFASLLFIAVAGCGDDAPEKTQNGEACELGEECASEVCYLELVSKGFFGTEQTYELTDGMCTDLCEWPLDGTIDERWQGSCIEDELCLVFGTSDSICFQECSEDLTCREDYECVMLAPGKSSCLPPSDAARVIDSSVRIRPAFELEATK